MSDNNENINEEINENINENKNKKRTKKFKYVFNLELDQTYAPYDSNQ